MSERFECLECGEELLEGEDHCYWCEGVDDFFEEDCMWCDGTGLDPQTLEECERCEGLGVAW